MGCLLSRLHGDKEWGLPLGALVRTQHPSAIVGLQGNPVPSTRDRFARSFLHQSDPYDPTVRENALLG